MDIVGRELVHATCILAVCEPGCTVPRKDATIRLYDAFASASSQRSLCGSLPSMKFDVRCRANLITILLFPAHNELASQRDKMIKKQRKNMLRDWYAAVAGVASIRLTLPHHKARAATSRPTAPPERVSISVLRARAAAAPVASAAALEDADEAADAEPLSSDSESLEQLT
jgi:hypothetical protein